MKYYEALEQGWRPADTKYTRRYVSRTKFELDEAECHEGKGRRKGQLYILAPCWESTTYCYRHYLKKGE